MEELRNELRTLTLSPSGGAEDLDEIMWDVGTVGPVGPVGGGGKGEQKERQTPTTTATQTTPTKISRGVGTEEREGQVGKENVGVGGTVNYHYNYNYHYHYQREPPPHNTGREGTRNVGGY